MKAFEGADFIYAKNWAAYTGDNYGQILSTDRNCDRRRPSDGRHQQCLLHALPPCKTEYDCDG